MSWNSTALENGPVPLWWQIVERLRSAIGNGEFCVDEALPSEAQLNGAFGVSRTTARAALNQLEQDGLIIRQSGRGSIVLPKKVEQPINSLSGFAEDMAARGLSASYRTLKVGYTQADATIAEALGLERGARVYSIERLLSADGEPMALSEVYLHPDVLDGRRPTRRDLDRGSLYQWLEDVCGTRVVSAEEFIEASTAGKSLAQALHVPVGSAVLIARRACRSESAAPVEYDVVRYRSDRYRFRVELSRK